MVSWTYALTFSSELICLFLPARAAMIPGPSIVRAWDSPNKGLNPKTGLCQTVDWGPNINSSYLGKAYSEVWFSNACSVSTLVDRVQSTVPGVALQHGPTSLQANCWPLLSLPGWQPCGLGLKSFSNHLQILLPTCVQQNTTFSLLPKITPVVVQKSSSGNNPLWTLIFPPKKKRKRKQSSRSSYLCGFWGCEVTCLAAARHTHLEEWPLFSCRHFVASGWGSGKALLFGAGSRSMMLSPFP